jgi:membrane-bound serine protease (ClpP class)
MVAEAFLPSFGSLGLGGVVAFVAGALILIDTEQPGFGIPLSFIVTVAVTSALLIAGITSIALKSRRRAVTGGPDDLVGDIGRVVAGDTLEAWVLVRGETWRAESDVPLQRAQRIRVVARKGLRLRVEPLTDE